MWEGTREASERDPTFKLGPFERNNTPDPSLIRRHSSTQASCTNPRTKIAKPKDGLPFPLTCHLWTGTWKTNLLLRNPLAGAMLAGGSVCFPSFSSERCFYRGLSAFLALPAGRQSTNFTHCLLSCSVTLEKKGTLFREDHFSGAATKKKGKKGATEQLSKVTIWARGPYLLSGIMTEP